MLKIVTFSASIISQMIKFSNFSLRRGSKLLLDDVNVTIHNRQRVGIVGANGCGKSTLFDVFHGKILADEGDFYLSPSLVLSHVKQETPSLAISALEYVKNGDEKWSQIDQQIKQAEKAHDNHKLSHLFAELEAIDGYQITAKASKLLMGLGFSTEEFSHPISTFSGGWRMRLNLAQALICPSDVLLLDEPTNHLDLETVIWLENWLKRYEGTLLLISHDRDFLDTICTHILHIDRQQLISYTGNYSYFEQAKFEREQLQQSQFEKQEKEIKHIEKFVERFRAKATKARQVQSRIKSLEKIQRISSVQSQSTFNFSFFDIDKMPNPLISMQGVDIGYESKCILENVNFSLSAGERIGLLGKNGVGKSTFLKCLVGELKPLVGEINISNGISVAYFAQHQLEQLNEQETPFEFIRQFDQKASEQHIRNFLASFAFPSSRINNMADTAIAPFSGGEKARLVLASLVYQKPNLLLLDEPTNHLDLGMRHALTLALVKFQGTLIVIAHDRFLLSSITDKYYLLLNNKVNEFDGDLDDYWEFISSKEQSNSELSNSKLSNYPIQEKSNENKKNLRQQQAKKRKLTQPFKKEQSELELKIEEINQKLLLIEQALIDETLYAQDKKDELKSLLNQQVELKKTLESLEEKWFMVTEKIEKLLQE